MEKELIERAIKDLQEGKVILVMDDEGRENEGDFICAAEYATKENVNLMATVGKGLICMPMSEELSAKLALSPMVAHNTDNPETAFMTSIDYVGTTTGISAAERALTALSCTRDDVTPMDFRRPGHMFPLVARKGGVI